METHDSGETVMYERTKWNGIVYWSIPSITNTYIKSYPAFVDKVIKAILNRQN